MQHSCSYGDCGHVKVQLFRLQLVIRGFLSWLGGVIGKSGGVTLPVAFNASLLASLVSENGVFRVREFFLSSGTVWHKKLVYTELHISGSGSAYVGDRGICGLKPPYLPLHKSCFIAYTLANMMCIVTSLPAR